MNENKIFVIETVASSSLVNWLHIVVIVAAKDSDVAKDYIQEKLGIINTTPVLILGASYPTIYNQTGNTPEKIQAKILYNGTYYH